MLTKILSPALARRVLHKQFDCISQISLCSMVYENQRAHVSDEKTVLSSRLLRLILDGFLEDSLPPL